MPPSSPNLLAVADVLRAHGFTETAENRRGQYWSFAQGAGADRR
jgi:hypothetical protein